jgi:hypothetical protein
MGIMRRLLLLLGISVAVFVAAFVARVTLVPNVVAVAFAEAPQSIWALETAFLLRSVENVALLAAALMLALIIGSLLWPKLRGSSPEA